MVKSLICKNFFKHFKLCFDSGLTQNLVNSQVTCAAACYTEKIKGCVTFEKLYLELFFWARASHVTVNEYCVTRDANYPAILIPRGFGESGNGNFSFLGDHGK